MSEQGSGVGAFLLGLGLGAALGVLFAPEPGAAARAKLVRRLRQVAAERIDELGPLVGAEDDTDAPRGARAALARRLSEAKRRRRAGEPRAADAAEEDEPLA